MKADSAKVATNASRVIIEALQERLSSERPLLCTLGTAATVQMSNGKLSLAKQFFQDQS